MGQNCWPREKKKGRTTDWSTTSTGEHHRDLDVVHVDVDVVIVVESFMIERANREGAGGLRPWTGRGKRISGKASHLRTPPSSLLSFPPLTKNVSRFLPFVRLSLLQRLNPLTLSVRPLVTMKQLFLRFVLWGPMRYHQ